MSAIMGDYVNLPVIVSAYQSACYGIESLLGSDTHCQNGTDSKHPVINRRPSVVDLKLYVVNRELPTVGANRPIDGYN